MAALSVIRDASRDEPTLTARVRAGDEAAFETLFRTHYGGLCSIALGYLRSPDAAEDVVQNVFQAIWLHRATWSPTGPVGAYLRTAVRNEAFNMLRRDRRVRASAEGESAGERAESGDGRPDDAVLAVELSNAILDAAQRLAPRCRSVFLLKWQRGLTYHEIAERMGISVKTVEMQMTRALRVVRARVAGFRD